MVAIEPEVKYRASFWDPRNGEVHDLGIVELDVAGRWPIPLQPSFDDWVLVFNAVVGPE